MRQRSLLIAESPLQYLPTLGALIGVHEAIALQQVEYESQKTPDGWVTMTREEWCGVLKFADRTCERVFASLRSQGLLEQERLPGVAGRRSRLRVDHDGVEKLTEVAASRGIVAGRSIRQSAGFNPPKRGIQSAKARDSIRQNAGNASCKGKQQRGTAEGEADAPLLDRKAMIEGWIDVVFEAWATAVGTPGAVADAGQRRTIRKALRGRPFDTALADCVDAVRGWRHSAYHRGDNPDGLPKNTLSFLLRNNESITELAGYERHRGTSQPIGNPAADTCPGFAPGAPLTGRWTAIAGRTAELVPADTHDIWIRPMHAHAELDGVLVVGLPPELMSFVGGRLRGVLDQAAAAAGERPVTLVECSSNALREVNAA